MHGHERVEATRGFLIACLFAWKRRKTPLRGLIKLPSLIYMPQGTFSSLKVPQSLELDGCTHPHVIASSRGLRQSSEGGERRMRAEFDELKV